MTTGRNLRADTEISIDDVPLAISYAAPLRLSTGLFLQFKHKRAATSDASSFDICDFDLPRVKYHIRFLFNAPDNCKIPYQLILPVPPQVAQDREDKHLEQ